MKLKSHVSLLAAVLLLHIAVQSHADPPLLSTPGWMWPHFQFTVNGQFNAVQVVETSTDLQLWTPILTNSGVSASNRVLVRVTSASAYYRVSELPLALFTHALAARDRVDFNDGNNMFTDGFDSADPNFSTAGVYDPLKNKESGTVATPASLTNSLGVGNAKIMGHVFTGPGGSVSLGPAGSVGSRTWIQSNQTGIQPGWWTDNMTRNFPDLVPPSSSGAFTPGAGTVDGTNYQYVLENQKYLLSNLALGSSSKMRVIGNALLYVTGNISMAGSAFIEISPGATLKLYVGGSLTSIGGNGIVNNAGNATNFQYYGLASNTAVSLNGNGTFIGVIYAPSAALSVNAGGANTYDFIGAAVAKTVTVNGHWSFHYDENLLRAGLSP